ncbi:hypothetical protein ACROYT_G036596 [Oculina patagonica]
MSEYFDEDNCLKDFSVTEHVFEENPRTLFSPIIAVLEDSEEQDLERNKNFSNKNNLELPAVLLSPCVRTSKSELSLRSGSSSEFLESPSLQNVPRTRSTTTLSPEAKIAARGLPRKLSLSLPCSPSSVEHKLKLGNGAFNVDSRDHKVSLSRDEEIASDHSIKEDTLKKQDKFDFSCSCNGHGVSPCLTRDSRASLNSPEEETRESNNGLGSFPKPVRLQMYIETDQLVTEILPSNFAVYHYKENPNESVLEDECHNFESETNGRDFSLKMTSSAITQPSSSGLTDKQNVLFPIYETGCKQYSTPDLRIKETLPLPVDWRCSQRSLPPVSDALKNEESSARLKNTPRTRSRNNSSSTFLHPDMARFSGSNQSSDDSATSLLRARSSKSSCHQKRKTGFRQKFPHASSSINSSSSSAFVDSSGRSESSFMKSFLSLISPSRLLSKFHSSSKHSVQSTSSRSSRRKRRHIDFPDDDKLVTLNVSGRRFQIRDYFLTIYPNTLLGGKARSLFYDKAKNEFFFDRDPDSFRYIWNFYHSGQLHCPREDCVQSFLDEVDFFGLDISMLCECCWCETFEAAYERLTKRREEREADEKEAAKALHVLDPNASIRERAWVTLKDPSFSHFAKVFYLLSVLMIVISVVANTTETIACEGAIRICKEENEETYFYIDTVCVGFFTFEYVARLVTCPNRLKFIINKMSIIDLLAILPYYIDLLLDMLSFDARLGMNALVVLRVLRILRIFKLLRHSKRLKQLIQSVKDSATELGLIGFLYLVMVILFSSIIYFAELSDDTQFSSIPEAMWYAVITSTTAGYGDIIPVTLAGRLVGSACCLFGVLVIALPVPILQIK